MNESVYVLVSVFSFYIGLLLIKSCHKRPPNEKRHTHTHTHTHARAAEGEHEHPLSKEQEDKGRCRKHREPKEAQPKVVYRKRMMHR